MCVAGPKKPSRPISRSKVPAGRSACAWREVSPSMRGNSIQFLLMPPRVLQHAALDLVGFDRFEQRLEIAFAEALIALALDDLEEDRADGVLREDLQQQALSSVGAPSIRMRSRFSRAHVLAMALDAVVEPLVIGVRRVLERDAAPRAAFRPMRRCRRCASAMCWMPSP